LWKWLGMLCWTWPSPANPLTRPRRAETPLGVWVFSQRGMMMSTTETTTRTVYTYADKRAIGEIEMTDRQYARYAADGDRDTGAMSFADLMSYGLEYVASETVDLDTTIYVEE